MEKLNNSSETIKDDNYYKNYDGPDKLITSWEMQKICARHQEKYFTIHSNFFPYMSKLIGGFQGGEIIIVSGYTGQGKTEVCMSLTKDFEQQSLGLLWFSYEIQPFFLFKKFGVNIPLFMMPKEITDSSQSWLYDRIKESVAKYDTKFVFIDHLHYIVDMMGVTRQNKSDQIGAIMRSIKKIAIELNVCIFLVAHTTKPKGGDNDVLELGSVRDSSFIEQEADTVLYINRATDYENGSFIKIAKDRKNGNFNKTVKLLMTRSVMKEIEYV